MMIPSGIIADRSDVESSDLGRAGLAAASTRPLAAHDDRARRESAGRALELDRGPVRQVGRQRGVDRQPGRIAQDPLAPERQECGRVTGLDGRGLEANGPRHRLVPNRVGEGQDGIEPQDRVEIELERDVG